MPSQLLHSSQHMWGKIMRLQVTMEIRTQTGSSSVSTCKQGLWRPCMSLSMTRDSLGGSVLMEHTESAVNWYKRCRTLSWILQPFSTIWDTAQIFRVSNYTMTRCPLPPTTTTNRCSTTVKVMTSGDLWFYIEVIGGNFSKVKVQPASHNYFDKEII